MRPDILIRSGNYFNFLKPEENIYTIEDIAHALSHVCRFGGHTKEFYSVAQHSVLVAQVVSETNPELALTGLLHDATEAFLGDVCRPLKQLLPDYRELEWKTEQAIFSKFGVQHPLPAVVKHADLILLATEQRDLMPPHSDEWELINKITPLSFNISGWSPYLAKRAFLEHYEWLTQNVE
jgi:hypothetical protein